MGVCQTCGEQRVTLARPTSAGKFSSAARLSRGKGQTDARSIARVAHFLPLSFLSFRPELQRQLRAAVVTFRV